MTSTATPPAPDSPSSLPRMTQEFGTAPADTGTPDPGPRGHIGWIVACSLATGILAALLFVAAPFIPAEESDLTGAVLCGFALGWAMLAVLSVRFTDQPQRWAAAPAVFMAVLGVASPHRVCGRACGARLGVAAGPPGPRRVDVPADEAPAA